MLDRVYYGHVTPEGIGPEERIQTAGYSPIFYGESMGGLAFMNVIPAEKAARIICDGLLKDAFSQGSEGVPLLDPLLRDVGLYLGGGQLLLEDNWYNVYILTCDLGRMQEPVSNGQGILWGHVYQDLNGNGRYDQGEGIEGALVRLAGPVGLYGPRDPAYEFVSSRDGGYLAEVLPGSYKVNVLLKDGTVASSFRLNLSPGVFGGMDLAAGVGVTVKGFRL